MWSPNHLLATVTTGFGEHIAGPFIELFRLHTKSQIPALFEHYAPRLDAVAYRAAAEVFPTWFDELKPAFEESDYFFQQGYRNILRRSSEGSSGQLEY